MLTKKKQSTALLAAIKEYDANKWKSIGQKVGKPAKVSSIRCIVVARVVVERIPADGYQACEQYAKEHFGGKI